MINVQAFQEVQLRDYLTVNSGVELKATYDDTMCFYPKQDWRILSDKEFNSLTTASQDAFTNTISLIKVDPYISYFFWDKVLSVVDSADLEVRKNIMDNFFLECKKRILGLSKIDINQKFPTEHLPYELVFNINNSVSTSYDHQKKQSVGLHIDTHNVFRLEDRENGFQILSINLGKAERYFCFINLSVKILLKKLGITKQDISKYSQIRELKDEFLKKFANHPVYRITIPPEYAYIAPSQNIIHDGATNQIQTPDINFIIGGYCRWIKL